MTTRVPSFEQLLKWAKPEPPTAAEMELAAKVGPGDYEVYAEKLKNICLEAKEVFTRQGMAQFLRSGDMSISICSAKGDMVVGYCGSNHQVTIVAACIKFTRTHWADDPTVGIKDGDGFFFNAPLYGGSHAPDMALAMPVFHEDELIAWVAAGVHETDCGAIDPGGMTQRTTNRYGEGILIPPMKCIEGFRVRSDWLEMMAHNNRVAPMFEQDFRARAAGCEILRRRLMEVVGERGVGFVKGLLTKILVDAEKMTRERIASWNDGIYRMVVFTDLSYPRAALKRVCVSMIKEGDHLTFDFRGTSPECESSWNAHPYLTLGYFCMQCFTSFFHDLPVSNAIFGPIDFAIPEGCLYRPQLEAPVSMGVSASFPLLGAFPGCVYKAMFDSDQRHLVRGVDGLNMIGVVQAGVNQWGRQIAEVSVRACNSQGQGARTWGDGMDAVYLASGPASGRISDIEEDEFSVPQLMLATDRTRDGFGHGKFRGGTGFGWLNVVHGAPYLAYVILGTGGSRITPQQGLFGGYPAGPGINAFVTGCDVRKHLAAGKAAPATPIEAIETRVFEGNWEFTDILIPPKVLMEGEAEIGFSGGGAGYGDCLERDPESVMRDLEEGILSHRTAENVYRVAYDRETLAVDQERTREVRGAERKARLQRGKPYDEFLKEWSQRRPPEEILDEYGSWPDALPTRHIIRV